MSVRGRLVPGEGFPRWVRVVGALAGVLALVTMSLVMPPGSSAPVAHAADSGGSAMTVEHTFVGGKDAKGQQKTYHGSVTVSRTQDIQERQIVNVSWSGFEPTRNWHDLNGEADYTEFPVVLMQCWGTDTAATPMDPTHCQGIPYRPHQLNGPDYYPTTNDPNPNGTQGGPVNPRDAKGGSRGRGIPDTLGFTAVDGTHYTMWPFDGVTAFPPSLQLSAAIPSNALVAFSDSGGGRSNVQFEVRGGTDLPVLGCGFQSSPSAPGACTLEVIPIVQPWCNPNPAGLNPSSAKLAYQQCIGGPKLPVGWGRGYGNGFLAPSTWWLTTQWQHRFTFPLSMAPQRNCKAVDPRPELSVAGSEAATVLMRSWSAKFCLDPRYGFKASLNIMPEGTARSGLAEGNSDIDAAVTALPVTGSSRPVVHAPIAATGWTVAYALDQHDDARNNPVPTYTDLTLSPLLLAKLMTSSYNRGATSHPGLAGNPPGMWDDPEFKALNPTFKSRRGAGVGAGGLAPQVVWVSPNPEDSFAAMFSYIDADPQARAWLNGKLDEYSGMVVNPAYRGLAAPQAAVQFLDDWVYHPPTGSPARCAPLPWSALTAQTAPSLDATALTVLNRKAPMLLCGGNGTPQDPYHWISNPYFDPSMDRQVLAFTTVSLAEKYGLSMAKLQSHVPGAKPVAPSGWENYASTYSTMEAALSYTKQDKDTGVVSPDFSIFPPNGAYPGTMPIYAAVPTSGLDKTMANYYADWLEYAAGPGQTPGTDRGQLPPGYTPLPQAYRAYTLEAARHVRAQDGVVPPPPDMRPPPDQPGLPAPGSPDANNAPGASNPSMPGTGVPGSGSPSGQGQTTPGSASGVPSAPKRVDPLGATRGSDNWLARWGLAMLVLIGLVAGAAVPLVQIVARPGHPVRRFFARVPASVRGAVTRRAGG